MSYFGLEEVIGSQLKGVSTIEGIVDNHIVLEDGSHWYAPGGSGLLMDYDDVLIFKNRELGQWYLVNEDDCIEVTRRKRPLLEEY